MSTVDDFRAIAQELDALIQQVTRTQDNLFANEARVGQAIDALSPLDDDSARLACHLARSALDELRNALYGALSSYETEGEALLRTIPR
jgi:hypothetical protein